jgi:hypothetical protein
LKLPVKIVRHSKATETVVLRPHVLNQFSNSTMKVVGHQDEVVSNHSISHCR